MRKTLLAAAVALFAVPAQADQVTIDLTLDDPGPPGTYLLGGQSAFVQYRTSDSTSGGQLDFIYSGTTQISFTEVFPPPALSDYLGFAYFGLMHTYDGADESPIDTSLVMAFQPGTAEGLEITDFFPLYSEDDLVTALSTTTDSPEFLYLLGNIGSLSDTVGVIAVPSIGRPGDTLDLIAFTGGVDGDLGAKVGTLATTVVPEPTTIALLALSGAGFLVRRPGRREGPPLP